MTSARTGREGRGTLHTSGDGRLHAYYELRGAPDPGRVARALVVEQTIEFPEELVADLHIRDEVVGRVERIDTLAEGVHGIEASYSADVVGGEFPQLLSVLYGNCSMWPRLRLVDVSLPASLLSRLHGPRLGVAGVRALVGAEKRPLLATAAKPLGSSPAALATMVFEFAAGGIDIIKDDQGLANQPYAAYSERVARCSDAVRSANERYGTRAIYVPCVNGPHEEIDARVREALDNGAMGVMVLPGVVGYDLVRHLSSLPEEPVAILTHPSMLGAFVADASHGISPGLVFGALPRLGGADLAIYPHAGGRFQFSLEDCAEIGRACRADLGGVRPALPTPGGGMTLERVPELTAFYGADVALLIGGDLHRGDLRRNAELFRSRVEADT